MANSRFQKVKLKDSPSHFTRFVKFGLLNIRSIRNSVDYIYDLLCDGLDVLILTETWHGSSNDVCVGMAMPPGYVFVDFLRINDPFHGGIIIFFRENIRHLKVNLPLLYTLEAIALRLSLGPTYIIFFAIYRPGSQMVSVKFFEELTLTLEYLLNLCDHLILVGDLNIHIEKRDDLHAIRLKEIFTLFNMANIVSEPTHLMGGTLDLIVPTDNLFIVSCSVQPSGVISDHSFIEASMSISLPPLIKTKKYVRSWSRVDNEKFISLVEKQIFGKNFDFKGVDEAVDFFEREIRSIVDMVAPLHVIESRYVPTAPWFDSVCRECKRSCRKFELIYRSSKNNVNKKLYINALKHKNRLYTQKRREYWKNITTIHENSPNKLWKVLGKLLSTDISSELSSQNTDHTSNGFLNFFNKKIVDIRASIHGFGQPNFSDNPSYPICFSGYLHCSSSDIKTIIMDASNKTGMLDLLPTGVFKQHIDLFLPFLTGLVNLSLSSGIFPTKYKHAIVIPLLKKTGQDINNVNNYRPVSTLSFVSKIIEKIVAKQIISYLATNNLLPINQSGYRQHHSTETLLLQVTSELFKASDAGQISILALLDMSAAFDCVDHDTLLRRLSISYGIGGSVLDWLRSYLFNRSQQVYFNNVLSDNDVLKSGVPQGSVLGPLLFMLYTADVLNLVNEFGFRAFAYADDIQLVASTPPNLFVGLTERLVNCLSKIDVWMSQNGIRMNKSKTNILPVGTWQRLSQIDLNSVRIDDTVIDFCRNSTVLGFTIDTSLNMCDHVKKVSAMCMFQFRRLRLIKKCLTKKTLCTLMHAFIHSRLDYCNSLLYGVSKKEIAMLQSVQNRSARIVTGSRWCDHITPVLNGLHWLPIHKRIIFKIAVMVFRCLNHLAPKYLADRCLQTREVFSDYDLRSSSANTLVTTATKLKIGSRNFSVSGPSVWNALPCCLRQSGLSLGQFKKELKTHLFQI